MPKIHKLDGKEYYFDPIRESLVLVTPEETVRQQELIYLMEKLHVPKNMIQVEVPLAKFGVKSKERADIVILKEQDERLYALAVIECKAADVFIDKAALEQMTRYADALGATYSVVTNCAGDEVPWFYDDEKQQYMIIKSVPTYADMLAQKAEFYNDEPEESEERIPFGQLAERYKQYVGDVIGVHTPARIAIPAVNLYESLMDKTHRMPAGDYKLFRVIEDKGLVPMRFGNASGYGYAGAYRSFDIAYGGKLRMVSLTVTPYGPSTILCVGITGDGAEHHALQYNLDREMAVVGKEVVFEHSGRIAVGRSGSGRAAELRQLVVHRYPSIVAKKRFDLGTLLNDHLWYLDDGEETKLIENLIAYALLRDEYRQQVKARQ